MKIHRFPRSLRGICCALVLGALLPFTLLRAAPSADSLLGRWALTIPGDGAGWLELKPEKGWYDGSILWGGGSVLPLSSVVVVDGTATLYSRITPAIAAERPPGDWQSLDITLLDRHVTVVLNGKGSINFPGVRLALDDIGYRGWLGIEGIKLPLGLEPSIRYDLDYLRPIFPKTV